MKYFIIRKGSKEGPLNLDELKSLKIESSELVWHEGLDDWIQAKELKELESHVYVKPPLTPEERIQLEAQRNKAKNHLAAQKIKRYNNKRFNGIAKDSFATAIIIWLLSSVGIGLFAEYAAYSEYDERRYSNYSETSKYAEDHTIFFRPFKAIFSTVYLSTSEQNSRRTFRSNMIIASFITMLIIVGVCWGLYLIFMYMEIFNTSSSRGKST